jgi:hypothetical protein
MAIELNLTVSGVPEEALSLAKAIASEPIKDEDKKVNLIWSVPTLIPGMTETTYELLVAVGVLSAPLSIVTSVIGNLITTSVAKARSRAATRTPQARQARISLSIVDLERGKIVKLELSQCDESESIAICKALIDVSRTD